ncbi:MAG: hypothetical protein QXY55_00150 [Candidatus Korarchaeota archaeon]|nr:hypothetical protein [Thermoproteota archaeon]MCR8500947.1 hypothetical protein [Thermoproteota archaeon]
MLQNQEKTSDNETLKPASELIKELLAEVAKKDPSIKLIAVVDDSGLVVGAYPMRGDQIEIIENIGGVISEVYRCALETLKDKSVEFAEKVSAIVIGLGKHKVEFHKHMNYAVIIFKSIME